MGKSDQKKTQNAITRATDSLYGQMGQGIQDTSNRIGTLTPRVDAERANILSGYQSLANTGGISPADEARLNSLFGSFIGPTGGFDAARLAAINGDTSALRDFARSGGVSAENIAKIDSPTLEEFSKTGGYSPGDISNIRARSNSPIAATYANLKNNLDRQRLVSGGIGPGWSETGFKLARQGAQDIGTNARNTEVDISNAIRSGRFNAADTIAKNMLALSELQGRNTLAGYGTASNTDLGVQEAINRARLSGGAGLTDLARLKQSGRTAGLSGLLSTYGAAPEELLANQNLLRGYRGDLMSGEQGLIGSRIGASQIPGIGSTISRGLGVGAQIAGLGAGIIPGLSSFGRPPTNLGPVNPRALPGYSPYPVM